jgi:hypothetical protein
MDFTADKHEPEGMRHETSSTPNQSPKPPKPQYRKRFDEAEYKRWMEKTRSPKPQ